MKYKKIDSGALRPSIWKVGYIRTDFHKLSDLFGDPKESVDSKVGIEWTLKFEDGTIAIIHDWKEKEGPERTRNWTVKGNNMKSFYYMVAIVKKHYKPTIRDIFGETLK